MRDIEIYDKMRKKNKLLGKKKEPLCCLYLFLTQTMVILLTYLQNIVVYYEN